MRGEHVVGSAEPDPEADAKGGTSVFDPVLCELAYSWFAPPGGTVLDPFAGGSVRGVVASVLGLAYVGIELRAEQVAANIRQGDRICRPPAPRWICGDGFDVAALAPDVAADLIFSCPPYSDLERYSDDPRDLSTMDYPAFAARLHAIIGNACGLLREDRFACFVVGDVRDRRRGTYRNLPGDTIEAFEAAGLTLYNEAILLTSVGSLPVRVGRQFAASRKLGKAHQNVLVFVKGDPFAAAAACGPIGIEA
jgi:DNA modification methylase